MTSQAHAYQLKYRQPATPPTKPCFVLSAMAYLKQEKKKKKNMGHDHE